MEYPEYMARFYDVIYNKVRSKVDTDFFLNKIKETSGTVLEVGVGTGRFFADALQNGADIYGIDVSKNMIQILKSKINNKDFHRVFVEDICTMKLAKKFTLIIAPFRVFSHIISVKDQLLALQNIYNHLEDGGILIFDLYVPNLKMLHDGISNVIDFEGEYEPCKKLKRITSMKADLINQISKVTMKFIWDENNEERIKEWQFDMRFYFRYEIEHLIALSPLTLVEILGDYSGEKLNPASKEFIVVCKK